MVYTFVFSVSQHLVRTLLKMVSVPALVIPCGTDSITLPRFLPLRTGAQQRGRGLGAALLLATYFSQDGLPAALLSFQGGRLQAPWCLPATTAYPPARRVGCVKVCVAGTRRRNVEGGN